MPRNATNSARLVSPVGPFSHAVRSGELIYLSGQVGQDPSTGKLVEGGVVEEARRIFANLGLLLEDMGLSFAEVLKVNVFLLSMSDFAAMNSVYAGQFEAPFPARTTVGVKELPLGALIEIEMIARAR